MLKLFKYKMNFFPKVCKLVLPLYGINNNNAANSPIKINVKESSASNTPSSFFEAHIINHSSSNHKTISVHSQTSPIQKDIQVNYQSNVKIIHSKMYEAVSDGCLLTEVIRPSQRQNNAQQCFTNQNQNQEFPTWENANDDFLNGNSNDFIVRNHTYLDNKSVKSDLGIAPNKPPRPRHRRFFSQDYASHNKMKNANVGDSCIDIDHINLENGFMGKRKQVESATQTSHLIPYRLRFWPKSPFDFKCNPSEKTCALVRFQCGCKIITQWLLSQVGLTLVLLLWAHLGAYAFYKTEGPREQAQSVKLAKLQNELSIELATELRQTEGHEEKWTSMIESYLERHENMLLLAVSAGFGEGGGGNIWTYPGCILFAVSLLTTLGFGAPVPRTQLGRSAAVIFSAIGIPLHFLLILNMGNLGANKLHKLAFRNASDIPNAETPKWLKYFPLVAAIVYYFLGVIFFGFLRQRDVLECFMFPLDFTAAGGVATVYGHTRILYALYLEFAVTLAALVVSLIQASATRGVIDFGLRLGLLTNT